MSKLILLRCEIWLNALKKICFCQNSYYTWLHSPPPQTPPLFEFSPSYQNSPGSATPDTVRMGRRWRTRRSRHSAAYCCTTCTPWPGWCSWRSWCAKSRASYRDEHSDSVDSLRKQTNGDLNIQIELYHRSTLSQFNDETQKLSLVL